MRIKTEFPHNIREIENIWIPMPDGARLAARLWLPEGAEAHPVPAVLEYIPYRKDDGTAARDADRHAYFAGHGYACARVDLRGAGDSDGILYDEYLKQEQDDALEVLRWLASQPWCTGAVGMIGISWGGFNGLQVAARNPPELKAVISLCSTDDRYADDVHYMGGCIINRMLGWASTMFSYNALPPDPRFVGERWREMWFERMENSPPFVQAWMTHQRRDAYWKHGSVCEDYGGIRAAIYMVGGWADGYTNAIQRTLAGLPGPKKGLIGPWSHIYPHSGEPGPTIGFLQECLRWWDYWLKGIDTGVMDEPVLRAWMQDSLPPSPYVQEWPGRWVAERAWPSPDIQPRRFYLNAPGSLASQPGAETRLDFVGSEAHGLYAGVWCGYGLPGDLPSDQQLEDGLALCFDTPPLAEPMEVLGYPDVTLNLAVDRPNALVAVRLCDVAPTGASTRVSYGLLNLTHRESHEFPEPLEPGRRYTVRLELNALGHSLPAGHRWRVAVSPVYWPLAWPSPEPVTLTLFAGEACRLVLPTRPPRPEDANLPDFGPAEGAPPLATQPLSADERTRRLERDVITGRLRFTDRKPRGHVRLLATGTEMAGAQVDEYSIVPGSPLSAYSRSERNVILRRAGWDVRVETVSTMTADAADFHITNQLEAYEGGVRVFAKTWDFKVPRDHV
jgi:putative CocE/NonD family hydrolase